MGYGSAEVLAPAQANKAYFADCLDGLRITGSAHMLAVQT